MPKGRCSKPLFPMYTGNFNNCRRESKGSCRYTFLRQMRRTRNSWNRNAVHEDRTIFFGVLDHFKIRKAMVCLQGGCFPWRLFWWPKLHQSKWLWDRRVWSMFPLTRVPFGVPIFDPLFHAARKAAAPVGRPVFSSISSSSYSFFLREG